MKTTTKAAMEEFFGDITSNKYGRLQEIT